MACQHQPCHHQTVITNCSPPQCGGHSTRARHWERGIFQFYYTRDFAMSVFVTYFHISARFFWKSWKKSFLINVSHFMSSWNLLQIFCLLLQLTAELSFKIQNKMYFTSVAKMWVVILITWRWCRLLSSLSCLTSHKTDYFSVERQSWKVKLTHWLRWKVNLESQEALA